MNRQKIIVWLAALALMAGGAGFLMQLRANQRLGAPGVKTEKLPGAAADAINVRVVLPESVLHYESKEFEQEAVVTNTLPADTSYGQRRYVSIADPNDWVSVNVVLMGTDRTSIHKPQYCLEGAGWKIDSTASQETTIPIQRPQPYELPVIKLVATRVVKGADGQPVTLRGLYVYWFVADGALSGDMSGGQRMWWMAKHLLLTGELQRWAYVSCFTVCLPGQEDATFARMKKFIAASVPEFQLTPKAGAVAAARP
jgi:hypothetical protein